jgi:ABC-type antimicrobial peptide transport system permease subunit
VKTRWVNQLGDSILIPLSVLEAMEGSKTKFTAAHFTLDPKKNRELSQFRADMESAVKDYGAGVGELRFLLWDEELRIVIGQLEKNLSLFKLLYPVMMAVSVLIGSSLCFLLLLQAAREAAILRVLGTTRAAVRLAFIMELFFLSILGVVAGLGISWFLWMVPNAVPAVSLWAGAGLYLTGVLSGSVAGAIAITRKKPIELLQVKE